MKTNKFLAIEGDNQILKLTLFLVFLMFLSACGGACNIRLLGEVGVLTGGFSLTEPSIAIDSNNNVHIVGANSIPESKGVYYKKLDNNGNPLTGDVRATNDTSYYPSIAIDSNSNVHITWQGELDGIWGIYYKKLDNNGDDLTREVRVTISTNIMEPPSIAIDLHNNVYIAWQDYSNREVRYKKLDNNGNNLTGEVRVGNARGRSSEKPSIAIDSNNNVHVVWGNDDVIYFKKLDDNGNDLTGDIRISQGFSAVRSSIAIDSNNNIHIVWQDARRSHKWDIYYKKLDNDGTDLTGEIKLINAKRYCNHPSIVVDSNNNVHIAWEDDRNEERFKAGMINYEIYYKKLDNNGNDLTGDLRVTNAKLQSVFPSIAVDSNNNVHIAWYDGRYENSKDWRNCGIYYNKLRLSDTR